MIPSLATALVHRALVETPSQYHKNFPLAGSNPQTSPGTENTNSCLPPGKSTRIGVPQQPLRLSAGLFQTSLPVFLSNAIRDFPSAVAGTMTRFLYRIGLDAEPHPIGAEPAPTSLCQS